MPISVTTGEFLMQHTFWIVLITFGFISYVIFRLFEAIIRKIFNMLKVKKIENYKPPEPPIKMNRKVVEEEEDDDEVKMKKLKKKMKLRRFR